MSEQLLNDLLSDILKIEIIIKWLKNEELEECTNITILDYECSQGEFIIYFLNYLHESTSSILQSFSNHGTPRTIRTPRRINSFSLKVDSKNNLKKNARVSLFSENEKNQHNESLDIIPIDDNNKSNYSFQLTSTPGSNKNQKSFNASSLNFKEAISPIHKSSHEFTNSSFCLGDFITSKSSSKKKNSRLSKSKETNDSLQHTQLNVENCFNHSNTNHVDNSCTQSTGGRSLKRNSLNVKRRINPTNLSQNSNSFNAKRISSHETKNSFSFKKISEKEISIDDSQNQRDVLIEERLKIQSKINEENNILTPRQLKTSNLSSIQPSLDLVTYKNQLNILVEIYSTLFDLNLILNPLSELYFLISLVLLQVTNHTNQEIDDLKIALQNNLLENTNKKDYVTLLLTNIHNCVYFALHVLYKQNVLLSALDRTSLKLLSENPRIVNFVPDLTTKLITFYNQKIEKKVVSYSFSGKETVTFFSETDNRQNFSTEASFVAFRKQRDLFYEILRSWETNHLQADWEFSKGLHRKIQALIYMHSDPTNLMHLARLFKNQLLSDCTRNSEQISLPIGLNIDEQKLNLLRDRLVCKKISNGPSPEPSFLGQQEFYKEFILICPSHFNRHLIDCFSAEILQLDDVTFDISDVNDSVIDTVTKRLFLNTIISLKILAKFLGFLEALPYKSNVIPEHQVLVSQIALRKHFLPSIDICGRFFEALKHQKLILFIPWVVDYLAMLDYTSLRLPYFSQLIENLFDIHYKFKLYPEQLEKNLMIKLSLGWLFERPNFPLNSYQLWISEKYSQKSLKFTESANLELTNINDVSWIDSLDFIDELILFACCPYLYEIQNFLSSDSNSNFNKLKPSKYIRPISTVTENTDSSNKRILKRLDEAFLNNQSPSTKKIIDLVAERTASNCVKLICNKLAPDAKSKALEKFQKHLEHVSSKKKSCAEVNELLLLCCRNKAKQLSIQCFEQFKTLSKDEISKFTENRCQCSLNSLLFDDIHSKIKDKLVSITFRQSMEKIQQWFDSHINPGIFLKEFVSEMDGHKFHYCVSSINCKLPGKGKNINHDPNTKSPVVIMCEIREIVRSICKQELLELEIINTTISDAFSSCEGRCDLSSVVKFTICNLFLDMVLMLGTYRPDLISETLIDSLILFWNLHINKNEKKKFFNRIFCPRNIGFLEDSQNPEKSWKIIETLTIQLMDKQMLTPEQFEEQVIAMFRFDWQFEMLQYFRKCIQVIIDTYAEKNGQQKSFAFIICWLTDYCNDDQFF